MENEIVYKVNLNHVEHIIHIAAISRLAVHVPKAARPYLTITYSSYSSRRDRIYSWSVNELKFIEKRVNDLIKIQKQELEKCKNLKK